MGLITVAQQALPGSMGTGLATLGIAVVGLHEIMGPLLFKWGLTRAGEIPVAIAPSESAAITEQAAHS